MCAISMEELNVIGLKEALKIALSKIDPDNKRPLHVSFDIDALDPLEAPSTGTPGQFHYILCLCPCLALKVIDYLLDVIDHFIRFILSVSCRLQCEEA